MSKGGTSIIKVSYMNILVIILALMTGTAAADVDDSAAFQVGISYLDEHALEWGIRDAGEEFQLNQVIRDETGYFHVRVDQVYNGIHVLGKQLVVHMNNNLGSCSARSFLLK